MKRSLGIPHLSQSSQSKRARFSALGIRLPTISTPPPNGTRPTCRTDAPVLRVGTQADSGKTSKPSDNISSLADVLQEYEKDKYSASSASVRLAVEKAWMGYHDKAHILDPLTVSRDAFPIMVD